jgi:hypothetical protein
LTYIAKMPSRKAMQFTLFPGEWKWQFLGDLTNIRSTQFRTPFLLHLYFSRLFVFCSTFLYVWLPGPKSPEAVQRRGLHVLLIFVIYTNYCDLPNYASYFSVTQ